MQHRSCIHLKKLLNSDYFLLYNSHCNNSTDIEDVEDGIQQDLHYLGILYHQKITQRLQSIGLQYVDHLQRDSEAELVTGW